jgi:hypothetical protein
MFTKQVTDSKAYQWFQERLEIQGIADDISTKYVPPTLISSTVWVVSPLCAS